MVTYAMGMKKVSFGISADTTPVAKEFERTLCQHYDFQPLEHCDKAIIIGGDGFMLRSLRAFYGRKNINYLVLMQVMLVFY